MSNEDYIGWYTAMLRIRLVEEEIARRYSEQEMRCPVHLCIGQEAVAVGVCSRLFKGDYVFGNHRSHGHYLAKGGDLNAMVAELYGKATGCSGGIGGSMHLVDTAAGFLGATPIVASSIPIAVGAAMGSVMRGENRVVVSFFGEAAVEEGVFHEAMNFASLKRLPIVFVCENNLYSVYSPLSVRQPSHRTLVRLVAGHGVKSVYGDGNDVEVVSRIAGEAIDGAREGKGPSFLEFETYRWREHVGPNYDLNLGYRDEREFLEWQRRDPVQSCRHLLVTNHGFTSQVEEALLSQIKGEIERAFAFALASPFAQGDLLPYDLVYADHQLEG